MADISCKNNINLNNLEIKNQVIEKLSDFPISDLVAGRLFYNTTTNSYYVYNGSSWISLADKQDLISSPTNNNIVVTDANGQSTDSGKSFSIDGTMVGNSDNLIPTEKAIITYIASKLVAVPTIQGGYDASGNTYPATRTDTADIQAGDYWIISVAGTLGGVSVQQGDFLYALTDTPGQTSGNWATVEKNFGFTPENVANKRTTFQATTDHDHYISEKLAKDSLDLKQNAEVGKGLSTNDYDNAEKAKVADSFQKSTDTLDNITTGTTNLHYTATIDTRLANTSGTNTGDETQATIKTKLGEATNSADGYMTQAQVQALEEPKSFQTSFVSGDFVSNVLTISNATHGLGTGKFFQVKVYDSSGVENMALVSINTVNGDVKYEVASGYAFDGTIVISK